MTLWVWMSIAAGVGVLVGVEAWAWTRHGTSAVGLVIAGSLSAAGTLLGVAVVVLVVGGIGYGMFSGVTGSDPLGLDDTSASQTDTGGSSECDPNYEGGCVPDTGADVDCTEISDTDLTVVGDDVDGLDRDGDGIACES
jgi:hypothetical protein